MRTAAALLTLALTLAMPAHAQEQKPEPGADGLSVGAGLVCNTKEQVERYLELFTGDPKTAAEAVNQEVGEPEACVFGIIAFTRGSDVTAKRAKDNELVEVAEIFVFGVGTEAGLMAIEPVRWYTLFPAKGMQI